MLKMKLFYLLSILLWCNTRGLSFSIASTQRRGPSALRATTPRRGRDPNPDFASYFESQKSSISITPSYLGNVYRRPIVAGNWKLNPATKAEAIALLQALKQSGCQSGSEVVIFPPLPFVTDAISILAGTGIKIGAQNSSENIKGAFTGEIAPSMLASTGISHVLLGHSERRTLFGETDASINQRVKGCLAEPSLTVMLCVGETLKEYESNMLKDILEVQLKKALAGVSPKELLMGRVIIAYEPVWAIGTGLVATPTQAQNAHAAIRDILCHMYSNEPDVSRKMRIQYGGSVTPDSIKDLMSMPDVDGALVGGASLNADSFSKIIQGSCEGVISEKPLTSPTSSSSSGAWKDTTMYDISPTSRYLTGCRTTR